MFQNYYMASEIITIIGALVTIAGMCQAYIYKKEAKKYSDDAYRYKTQAYEQLKCLDMYSYAETLTSATTEICRFQAKDNNNRGGRLNQLFEHLNIVLANITKYTTILGDTENVKAIAHKREQINSFIMKNRANQTVDIVELSKMFGEIEELFRKEILVYQDKLNKD